MSGGARLALALLAGGCAAPAGEELVPAVAELDYRLSYDPAASAPVWRVELEGGGFGAARGLVVELENWGEWMRLDGYYLRALTAEPPLVRRPGTNEFELVPPPDWDGHLRVSYELALAELGSPARETFGALPYRAASYTHGVSANTLLALAYEDGPARVERSLTVAVPAGWTVFSGWSGAVAPGTRIAMESGGNTALSFGLPRAQLSEPGLEIVQWGGESDVTAALADFARRFVALAATRTGIPAAPVLRLVVLEPGMGGTQLDGAIVIGHPESFERGQNPHTLHFLAHEIFHDWLGGKLRPGGEGEGLAWFWEGFTEYLSLRLLAEAGLVTPEWFAERLGEHEQAVSALASFGATAFADPSVAWRDPAIEPLTYGGSALVAFALDVELHRRGAPDLAALLGELAAEDDGRFTRASLEAWVTRAVGAEFWRARFVAPVTSTLRADLLAAGFVEEERPASFAYVGVRLDQPGPFGTVVAVDPDGPAHGIVLLGDRVSGLTPTHAELAPPATLAPDFPFGLAYYDPEAERVRFDVERGAEHFELWLTPRRLEGLTRRLAPGVGFARFLQD